MIHPPLVIAPDATVQQIAQQCWDFFEPTIRANPQDWLWAYRHWRYKPSNASQRYPYYAAPCKEFDRLLNSVETPKVMPQAA
ncbi:MAG: hypothetical protein QM813_16445 [Verrucomicrobiota bacterium]